MKQMDLKGTGSQQPSAPLTFGGRAINLEKLKEVQDRTYFEMCLCLEKHGLCLVERPTGFGKTKMFMDYVTDHPEGAFLYIYDMNSVKADIEKKYRPENVEFLSYSAISREKSYEEVKQFLCSQPWYAIIFDEAHLMGGENIAKMLLDIIPLAVSAGVKIVGGTATKIRTDMMDVSTRFFRGHGVSEYTMMDAINDGIMLEPVWTVTAHYKQLIKSLEESIANGGNSYTRTTLRALDRAYANIDGVSTVYHDTVEAVYKGIPDIMRFIIFYPTVQSIIDNGGRDIKEFKKAFPTHKVVHAALSTHGEHMSTVSEVEEHFTMDGKQVQLIFAVNMLNQAYHSTLLTGIVMYRGTLSNIIFTQELGRIMSVMSEFPGIVFDNVGNVFIRPERAMAVLQTMLLDPTKTPSNTHIERGHRELRLKATQEFIAFQQVYQRIMATQSITQEQIEYAKYLIQQMKAPIELVMDGLRVDKETAQELVYKG